ncbi:MAG TPA: phosphate/phosphite/phosphonate ABC transporter substrate-binding protein [Alphaproteobacteria bacterium]|nr:phosphate/phosphite/phosphonate ABC transporter substrate-binding protein [Alphaproteobacteria bacterium]
MRTLLPITVATLGVAFAWCAVAPAADAQECKNRGQLDDLYCDENGDLVADAPKDKTKWRNPSTLVFAYTPVEDPAVYENIFKPFTDYLAKCAGKRVVYYPVQSNSAEIEAMRSGRLHVAGFSTGPTGFAVNMAGAIPFAAKGTEKQVRGYHLAFVVKADSPYQKLSDLKDKKVAHTSPSSNSGNLAPRVLFPKEGLEPDKAYKVLYSGGHDKSALGVVSGDYDGAPVASDVLERMIVRGTIKQSDIRVIYKSETFPTSSFAYAHDLAPDLAKKVTDCFYAFRFTPEMTKEFNGDDRFFPITYQKEWAVVRAVAEGSGTPYNRAAYQKEAEREAAALKKKEEEKAKKGK